jgi:predicted Fe-Mo cluster-binding NifX family protein
MKQSIKIGEETKAKAEKATKKGRRVAEMIKELKDKALCVSAPGQMSYAVAAATGTRVCFIPSFLEASIMV